MYEQFTDQMRKVMGLANQEAQRFNHEHVGTEHILLGLAEEWSGVHAVVLTNLGLNQQRIRAEVEKRLTAGPEMVTMGMLPKTPNAKEVLRLAIEESRNLGHDYVGTGHLLLALMRNEGRIREILSVLGLIEVQVRDKVMEFLNSPSLVNAGTRDLVPTQMDPPSSDVHHAFAIRAAPALYFDVIRETDGEVICTPSDHQTHEDAEAELRGFGPDLKLLQHAAFTVDPGADNTLITLIALSNFGDGSDPTSLKCVLRQLIGFAFELGKKYGQRSE